MNKHRNKLAPTKLVLLAIAAGLAGCTVGPDFVRPAAPNFSSYDNDQTPAATSTQNATSPVALGQTLPAQWWELFRTPALTEVLNQAIGANQTLVAARATLAQAQETIVQARSTWYPTVSIGASAGRSIIGSGTNQFTQGQSFNQFSLGPSVSYTFDIAGQTARTVEQAKANAENQHYQLAAAYLTLTSSAVTQAITLAVTQKLLTTTEELIRNDEKNLELVQKSFLIGTAAQTDVLTAQSQLENDRTQLPALHQQLSVARHALAVLVGQAPSQWHTPDFDFDTFKMPDTLPVSLPSELVRQRPDILSAEALLHADSAAIGIATAQLYPSLTLSLSDTYQSTILNQLLTNASKALGASTDGNWTLFQGGSLQSQKRAAVDAYNAQLAIYRQTVLVAFGQVADALRAIDNDAESLRLSQNALQISTTSLRLQRASYSAGKSNVLQLITAENSYAQASMNYVRVQGQRLQDCVTLFAALGGNWQAKEGIGLSADK
ncbi:efflux transporter outer membrane subunit [Glaciimonas soli]|nr:efflux transporter outer membrane subunit [Glaciimonas soli]